MNRFFTAILLLLISGAAFADETFGQVTSAFTPPATDYSVAYLSQIFGHVSGVLQGTSGQMLGHLFEIFNKGIVVVTALFLGYSTVTIGIRAAHEGSFIGQNKNVPMLFLRIALGFSLIIPSPVTGYSILQDMFMKIVVAGVGLADKTWNTALNYMQYGGSLYIQPSTLTNDENVITAAFGSASTPGVMAKIFLSEICMFKSADAETGGLDANSINPVYVSPAMIPGSYQPGDAPPAPVGGIVYFPSFGQPLSPTKYSIANGKSSSNCGYAQSFYNTQFSTMQAGFKASKFPGSELNHLQITSWAAVKSMADKLIPVAKSYTCSQSQSGHCSAEQMNTTSTEKQIFSALLSYSSLMSSYQNVITPSASGDTAKTNNLSFLDEAKAQGWIMAGGFYWNVEQANNNAQQASLSQIFPSSGEAVAPSSYMPPSNNISTCPSESPIPLCVFLNYQGQTTANTGTGVAGLWQQYIGVQQNTIVAVSSSAAGGSGNGFIDSSIGVISNHLNNSKIGQLLSSGYNPIVALMNTGNYLLAAAVDIWLGATVIAFGLGFLMGICSSTSSAYLAFQALYEWVKSLVMLIVAILLVPGFILSYYVPYYPFIIFILAAIGWMAMVIEGMAAAPLVCMGLTHPEGHDFLGKSEQALMLFLSIFLRPVLLVIGLIASMIVSFVAFKMLIAGFVPLFNALPSDDDGFFLSGVFNSIMILVIFGFIAMQVVEQSFKLTYQLPNNIMRWIGGPQMGEDYGSQAAAFKSTVSEAGGQVGKGMQLGTEGAAALGKGTGAVVSSAAGGGEPKGDITTTPPPAA